MSSVAASMAQDFLNQLAAEGSAVTWKQRAVTGTDPYGQPSVTFNPSAITAIVKPLQPRPMDMKLVEAGFQLQNYLWMYYNPSLNVQMLDRVTYAGIDYDVRVTYPHLLEGVAIYNVALLRFVTE